MSDDFYEVSDQGWGSRIMESIKGILFGIVLFVASFPILFFNEGCAVKTRQGLNEVQRKTVSVSADKPDSENDGEPVHFTAKATTTETLQDPIFKVKTRAIKLVRTVEMYQWKEEKKTKSKKKLGGGKRHETRYTYSKVWSTSHKPSKNFKKKEGHVNPRKMPYSSKTVMAKVVMAGGFQLNQSLIAQIQGEAPITLKKEVLRSLPEDMAKEATISNAMIYVGQDSSTPKVGDLKIRFKKVKPAEVTVIAKQRGELLKVYRTKSKFEFCRLEMGEKSIDEVFSKAHKQNEMRTWALRIGGFVAMLIGIFLVLRPIAVLGDVVPFIGSIVGGALLLVAGLISIGLSFITIYIAWIFYRPIIGIPLFIVGVGALGFVLFTRKKKPAASHQGF